MTFELKRFGTLGGMGKGNMSFQLFSYLIKEEIIDDLLVNGYFSELKGVVNINDIIQVLDLKQDGEYKQLEYLLITGIHIRTGVEVKRLDSVYLPATTAPLKDNETAIIGTAVKFARADHRHPKTIATETIIGQLAIATEIESLEETLDNKIITPIIK